MKKFLMFAMTCLVSLSVNAGSESICAGDRVIDERGNRGYVDEVYSNKKALVRFDRLNDAVVSVHMLSRASRCENKICVYDRVIDWDLRRGYVMEVFENGKAYVEFDKSMGGIVHTSRLSRAWRCVEGICVGAHVMDVSNFTGYIGELFANGMAFVNYQRIQSRVVSLSILGYEVHCLATQSCRYQD